MENAKIINLSFKDDTIYGVFKINDRVYSASAKTKGLLTFDQNEDYVTYYYGKKNKDTVNMLVQKEAKLIIPLETSTNQPFIELKLLEDTNERSRTNANTGKYRQRGESNRKSNRRQNKIKPRPTKKYNEKSGQNR